MNTKSLKIFALFGALSTLILLQDFLRFSFACRAYGKKAQLGLAQLKLENGSISDALVVITGDKRRIPASLELLRNQPDSWLFISGVSKKTNLAEIMSLNQTGGNENGFWNRVILDSNATSTVENAEETEKFIQARNLNRIILITSDYHMLRALTIFKKRVSARVVPFVVGSEFTDPSVFKLPATFAKFLIEYWKWVAFRFDIY